MHIGTHAVLPDECQFTFRFSFCALHLLLSNYGQFVCNRDVLRVFLSIFSRLSLVIITSTIDSLDRYIKRSLSVGCVAQWQNVGL